MANAADLIVKIRSDNADLKRGLSESKSAIDSFTGNTAKKLLAAFTLGAAVKGIKDVISEVINLTSAIDDLNDNALRLGITVQQFESLAFAAKLSGSSVESLTKSFTFLEASIDKARDGTGEQAEAFRRLGLDAAFLKMLSPEKQFEQVAAAMARVTDQSTKVNLTKTIFGRGGLEILPLLNADLKELDETFKSLGIGITESQQKAADAFDKSRGKFQTLMDGIKNQIAVTAAPAFTALFESIVKNVSESDNLQISILETASSIVTFTNIAVKGMSFLYNSTRLVIAGLKELASLTQYAGAAVGSTLYEAVNKDQLADEGVVNTNMSPTSAVESSKRDFLQTVEEARRVQSDFINGFSTAIDPVSANLRKQIDDLKAVNANKSSTSAGAVTRGFGEIIGEDGRVLSIGTRPSNNVPLQQMPAQKVDVNISLDKGIVAEIISEDGRVKQYTREQIQEFMNDSARGQTN